MTLHVILRLHYHLMCCLGARKHVLELEKYFGVKKVMKKLRKKIIMKKKCVGSMGFDLGTLSIASKYATTTPWRQLCKLLKLHPL